MTQCIEIVQKLAYVPSVARVVRRYNAHMEKVQLDTTGAIVSAACLGTDHYGTRTDTATAYTLLDAFFEAGGTFIDTANMYANWAPNGTGGDSEAAIGGWIKERGNRDQVFIGTKVGEGPFQDTEWGLRGEQIERACEDSLAAAWARHDRPLLCAYRRPQRGTRGSPGAFDRLVATGKVRFIGACNHTAWRLAEARTISAAHGWASYAAVQQRYSYTRPKPNTRGGHQLADGRRQLVWSDSDDFGLQVAVNADLLDYCAWHGLTLIAYSTLLSGAYTRADRSFPEQYLGPDTDARVEVLRTVAERVGASPDQVVLAWMRHSTPAVVPIIGGSTVEQITHNIEALSLKLSEEQMTALDTARA